VTVLHFPRGLVAGAVREVHNVRVLTGAGVIRLESPRALVGTARAIMRWGFTPAGGYAASAVRYPGEAAIIDELGSLTFAELDRRSNAIARGLAGLGVRAGEAAGVMCRNHRGFVEATVALSKLGADCLYLNTGFAAPQLAEVCEREKVKTIIHDQEFTDLLGKASRGRRRVVAWHDSAVRVPTLESLAAGDDSEPDPPAEAGRVVILTSGTTGAPKGARRSQPKGLGPAASLLSRIPLKVRQRSLIAAPLFHSWGMANFELGMLLAHTIILQRKFDPEATLRGIQDHRPDHLAAVPVMIQRIMEVPPKTRKKYDASSLRTVGLSGSTLPGELAEDFMDAFGDIIYNLYGSTEVAWATIATPADLRAAPGTAGRPPMGTTVKLLDPENREVPQGETGRIFVANDLLFEGYTGGGSKDEVDGLMSTGDVGRFDENGLLFVDGRDDEMIVSGGENVFPREVEDLLVRHRAIAEAAVVGVPDKKFGQRLTAFIVKRKGATISAEQVQEHVRSNLARFKVPREVQFIDALPRNSTGKVLKRELVESATGAETRKPRAGRRA
jgi:acyl-CoA synthetase (AMP-forming)/AMP-acid ligase II